MPKAVDLYPDTQFEAHIIKRNYLALIPHWLKNYKSRKSLHQMNNRLLQDIGINRAQAETEAAKPFWR